MTKGGRITGVVCDNGKAGIFLNCTEKERKHSKGTGNCH